MGIGRWLNIRKTSAWTFETSATAGLGLGPVAASGGKLVFQDPSKKATDFHYVAGGFGVSAGVKKLPKVERIVDPKGVTRNGSVNGTAKKFKSYGYIFVMDGCRGDDLEADDFVGACCMVEVGASLIAGYSGAAVLMNVDPVALVATLANPLSQLPLKPTAMFLTHGWNAGMQASIGLSEMVGYLWLGAPPDAANQKRGLRGAGPILTTKGLRQIMSGKQPSHGVPPRRSHRPPK